MESVFEAFISNPALYSAGHLVGETLHFPTNTEEVQSLLKRIGVDGVRCQEYFIISFDSDILGLYNYLGEYENIDELNHLAHLLKELSPSERETLEAVMDSGQHCGSVQDLINLTQNLDCYDFHPGVDNEEMLGRLYVEDMESLEVPDNIKPYKNRSRTACTMHSIKHNRLEAAVLFAVQQQVHLAVSYSEMIARINTAPVKKSQSIRLEELIAAKERELAKISRYKQSLYQDWKDGEITQQD